MEGWPGRTAREYSRKKEGELRKERQEYPRTSLAEAGKKFLGDNKTASDAGMSGLPSRIEGSNSK